MSKSEKTSFWLIEKLVRDEPRWMKWRNQSEREWTSDATAADRFEWEVYAQKVADDIAKIEGEKCTATEHQMLASEKGNPMLQLTKIADLADKDPGVYEGTFGETIYTVAVGNTGVDIATRPAKGATLPPPDDGWKTVEEIRRLTPEEGITQVLYPAQPNATAMRLRCSWTAGDVGDEYEILALVSRKGEVPKWPDLPLYFTVRNGDAARFRTGVGDIKMTDKSTDEATWAPKVGVKYDVEAVIWGAGDVELSVREADTIILNLYARRPPGGKPGPWKFPLMVQLGGPTGKAGGGHYFENVILRVEEGA